MVFITNATSISLFKSRKDEIYQMLKDWTEITTCMYLALQYPDKKINKTWKYRI